MNRLRLKHEGDKLGIVQTILPKQRQAVNVSTLTGDELAQLIVDVMTLPQVTNGHNHTIDGKPKLRPGEDRNLLKLFFTIGYNRYGGMFDKVLARCFMNSLPS